MKFNITIRLSESLSTSQIWPDGDAPQNPTSDDVYKLLLRYHSLGEFLDAWSLGHITDVEVAPYVSACGGVVDEES